MPLDGSLSLSPDEQFVRQVIRDIPGDFFKCASDGDYAGARYLPRGIIDEYDSILLNREDHKHLLTADLDDPDVVAAVFDLPYEIRPNLLVVNPENGHAHADYFLADPIHAGYGARAMRFFRDIHRRLTLRLGGDPNHTNQFTKNPLHPRWEVHVLRRECHRLGDLSGHLPSLPKAERSFVNPARLWIEQNRGPFGFTRGGRNHDLFWWACHGMYGIGQEVDFDKETLLDRMSDQIAAKNAAIEEPLFDDEVDLIARNAASYVSRNPQYVRHDPNWNFGVMGLRGTGVSLDEAQSLAAGYTHKLRNGKTIDRIKQAILATETATKKGVARATRLCVQTVRRHWNAALAALGRLADPRSEGRLKSPLATPTMERPVSSTALSPVIAYSPPSSDHPEAGEPTRLRDDPVREKRAKPIERQTRQTKIPETEPKMPNRFTHGRRTYYIALSGAIGFYRTIAGRPVFVETGDPRQPRTTIPPQPKRPTKRARAAEIRQRISEGTGIDITDKSSVAAVLPETALAADGACDPSWCPESASGVSRWRTTAKAAEVPQEEESFFGYVLGPPSPPEEPPQPRQPSWFIHDGRKYHIHRSGAVGYWRRDYRGKSQFVEVRDPRSPREDFERYTREMAERGKIPISDRIKAALARMRLGK